MRVIGIKDVSGHPEERLPWPVRAGKMTQRLSSRTNGSILPPS